MQQTKVLAACYLSFVAFDLLMMSLGDFLLTNNVDYKCDGTNEITRNSTFCLINLLALNNEGALFLLIYSLLLLAFTVMIWYVLYKIPDRLGLISKR